MNIKFEIQWFESLPEISPIYFYMTLWKLIQIICQVSSGHSCLKSSRIFQKTISSNSFIVFSMYPTKNSFTTSVTNFNWNTIRRFFLFPNFEGFLSVLGVSNTPRAFKEVCVCCEVSKICGSFKIVPRDSQEFSEVLRDVQVIYIGSPEHLKHPRKSLEVFRSS